MTDRSLVVLVAKGDGRDALPPRALIREGMGFVAPPDCGNRP